MPCAAGDSSRRAAGRSRWPCGCSSPSNFVCAEGDRHAQAWSSPSSCLPRRGPRPGPADAGAAAAARRRRGHRASRRAHRAPRRRRARRSSACRAAPTSSARSGSSESRAANLKDVLDFMPGVLDPPALRRSRREPALDPWLRPAQQLPPARRQRPDRRLPLRQRRRLQRLRVARAPDHQAHRGLQGRQRAALRRQHAGRRHQPRHQDRLRRRPLRAPQRGGLVRLPQELRRHRPGLRTVRPLRRRSPTPSSRAFATTPTRSGAAPTPPPATGWPAAPRCASTSASRHNRGEPARRPHPAGFERDPPPAPTRTAWPHAEARNYDYTRGAFTLRTPLTRTRRSSGRPSSTTRTSTIRCAFAIIDRRRPTAGATELR